MRVSVEQARDFFRSDAWNHILVPALKRRRDTQVKNLETATEMATVSKAQGAIAIIDTLLRKDFQDCIARELAEENQ